MRFSILLVWAVVCAGGCARMVVTKDPLPCDQGIRFYRPKPYLFIGPATPSSSSDSNKPNPPGSGEISNDQQYATSHAQELVPITIKIEYLPDYSEEYSIYMRPGLGQAELNVSLQNGWNLTSVGAKTDQKYAEIIGSVAQLAGAGTKRDVAACNMGGYATIDVPLGYYEAVIAPSECGRKELLGWRYVGFFPCAPLPINASFYRESRPIDASQLYSLVLKGNTLQMRPSLENCSQAAECVPVQTPRVTEPLPNMAPPTYLPGPAMRPRPEWNADALR